MGDVFTDETPASIDQKIQSHKAAILALIEKRNQLFTPISKLPPEILCKIFLYVKTAELEDYLNSIYSYTEWRRWIYLSHVSGHWRNVVLSFPSLYSLPLTLPHWVKEVLKRSRGTACLSVAVGLECPQSIQRLKKILPHGSQIKHLSLANMQLEHQEILEELQNFVPRLESLGISGPIPQHGNQMAKYLFIPDGLLTGGEKHLHRLELADCKFNWTSVSPHITHLQLCYTVNNTGSTFSQLMDSLGKMAEQLQHLELVGVFPFQKSEQEKASPHDRINFPLLEKLVVSCVNAGAKDFFTSIHFPPSATVDITLTAPLEDNVNVDPDFSVFLSSIAEAGFYPRSVSSDLNPFRMLFIAPHEQPDCYPWSIWLMLYTDVFGEGPDDDIDFLTLHRSIARLNLKLKYYPRDASSSSYINPGILAFFNSGFPLDKVSHVHLGISSVDSTTLTETVGRLPAVSFVNAERSIGNSFVNALHPNCREHGGTSAPEKLHSRLYFPQLTSIRIDGVVFLCRDPESNAGLDIVSHLEYDIDINTMQDCLTQRRECGVGIHKLVLRDCENLSDKNIDKLREIVTDVDWEDDPDWEEDNDNLSDGSSYSSDGDDDFSDEGDSDHSCSDSEDQELGEKPASDSEDSVCIGV